MPEGHVADELLDIHSPVAQRATLAVGLRDGRFEGHDAFQPRYEIGH